MQTGKFKQSFYQEVFTNYKLYYIYVLSPWFRLNCIFELNYLNKNNIPYYFSDENFVEKLIFYIKENV